MKWPLKIKSTPSRFMGHGYNGLYTKAKPMKTLELHNPTIQFLITGIYRLTCLDSVSAMQFTEKISEKNYGQNQKFQLKMLWLFLDCNFSAFFKKNISVLHLKAGSYQTSTKIFSYHGQNHWCLLKMLWFFLIAIRY